MNRIAILGISSMISNSSLKLVRPTLGAIFLLLATTMIAQPANDEPANAVALSLTAPALAATCDGATDSGLDLCDNGFNDEDDDIFYTFVAPASGNVSVELGNLTGTGQFPMMSILSGTIGSLACQNFSFETTASFTGLSSGVTYYLQVYSFLEDPSDVTFTVRTFETPSAPGNDDCANAVSLTIGTAMSGTIAGATDSGVDPCGSSVANDDVWYSFSATSTESSVYIKRIEGSDPGLRLGVSSGSCASLTSVACNLSGGESLHLTGLVIGVTYHVQVFSNSTSGAESTNFQIEVVNPPSNDVCSAATSVACDETLVNSYRGSTPSASTSCVTRGVWYAVTGTGGDVGISVTPTANNDVALELYEGACGSLVQLGCEDPGIEGEGEFISFSSIADEVYYVYVGESSFLDDNEGGFTLEVLCLAVKTVAAASGCNTSVSDVNMTASGDWLPIMLGGDIVGKIKDTEALGLTTISLYGNTGGLRSAGSSPFADRNITINPASSPSATIAVRLYYTAAEIDALIAADVSVTDISDLQFTKVSGTSCSGTFPGGGIQLTNTASGSFGTDYYVEASVAAFSEFFLSSAAAALPVELVSFTAFAKTGTTQIAWETASEQNVDYFSVERSSNGSSFESIGEVAAIGESSTLQSYGFVDAAPLQKGYYRLVSVDLDGSTGVSDVVYVEQVLAKAEALNVYPNPTFDVLNVSGVAEGIAQLIDPTGRLVAEQLLQGQAVQFQTAALPKGIYFVRVMSGTTVNTSQVAIK